MPALPTVAHPVLLATGLALLVVGWLLRRWAARHSLTDQATDAAWEAVRKRDAGVLQRELADRVGEIRSTGSTLGAAKKVAGLGVRHVLAQVAGWTGLVAVIAGLALGAAGIWWH